MQASKLVKDIRKKLPLLIAVTAVVTVLFMVNDLPRTSIASGTNAVTQLLAKQNDSQLLAEQSDLQPLIFSGTTGACFSSEIYTSLPPKCRTSDGSFIQIPGTSPDFSGFPSGK